MKKILFIILVVVLVGVGSWYGFRGVLWYQAGDTARAEAEAREEAIERVLGARRTKLDKDVVGDPFGDDGIVRVLLLGLDKRVGDTTGHCDVIQMVTIDTNTDQITITAVPRGTYAPLPPGKGVTSTDYYVSNACGLGGIEYGITQIEKILGQKADYLVIVGFSETLGILRNLKLPTTETLQWLRQRHVYQIGEPQRAHNHSTFLKEMIIKYAGDEASRLDKALHYVIYKTIQTDLSFEEVEVLVAQLATMGIADRPDDIILAMRPPYIVADIPYIPEQLGAYLDQTSGTLKNYLSKKDYSGASKDAVQEALLTMIAEKKTDKEFVIWAFENNLWLQIEDEASRLEVQFEFLEAYVTHETDLVKNKEYVSDYILEMEHGGYTEWVERGRALLVREIDRAR